MYRAFALLWLLTMGEVARAETPTESCAPGSSCWARLQSVESLGRHTHAVAGEVQRLAERQPELAALSARIARASSEVSALVSQIEGGTRLQRARLARATTSLREARELIRAGGTRYRDFEPVDRMLEELMQALSALPVAELDGNSSAALVASIERLTARLAVPPAPTAEPKDPDSASTGRAARKVSARDAVRDLFGHAPELRFAVLAVPDPRVPRLRRNFDLGIQAIHRAMAAHGAHFDRYDFPWGADQVRQTARSPAFYADLARHFDLRMRTADTKPDTPSRAWVGDSDENAKAAMPKGFLADVGVMLFRVDCNEASRSPLCRLHSTQLILALYLVAERGSDGPDLNAARDAWLWASVQQSLDSEWRSRARGADGPALLSEGQAPASNPASGESHSPNPGQAAAREVTAAASVDTGDTGSTAAAQGAEDPAPPRPPEPAQASTQVAGPSLIAPLSTSAIAPWRQALTDPLWRRQPIVQAHVGDSPSEMISPTVTGPEPAFESPSPTHSTSEVADALARGPVAFKAPALVRIASPDHVRFAVDEDESREFGLLVVENSQYGDSLLFQVPRGSTPQTAEREPLEVLRFNRGIWQLELGGTHGNPERRYASRLERRFARELLFDDADQGDELPPSFAKAIGARSMELELEFALEDFRRGAKPKPFRALILASDVRDQLYMSRAVRLAFPDIELLLPDADQLLAHPAYVSAIRGAKVIPIGNLCQPGADDHTHCFANDEMAMIFRAVHRWIQAWNPDPHVQAGASDSADTRTESGPESVPSLVVTRGGLRPATGSGRLHERLPDNATLLVLLTLAMVLVLRMRACSDGRSAWRLNALHLLDLPTALLLLLAVIGFLLLPHVGPGVSLAGAALCIGCMLALLLHVVTQALRSEGIREWAPPGRLPSFHPPSHGNFVVAALLVVAVIVASTLTDGAMPDWLTEQHRCRRILGLLALTMCAVAAMLLMAGFRAWSSLRHRIAALTATLGGQAPETRASMSVEVGTAVFPSLSTPFFAGPCRSHARASMSALGGIRHVLGTDMFQLRLTLVGALALSTIGLLAVYSFPFFWHARLLQLNLVLGLLSSGFLLIVLATASRDALLCEVFCGGRKLEFSPNRITLISALLVGLAGLVYLALAADGSDWYSDLGQPLIRLLRG